MKKNEMTYRKMAKELGVHHSTVYYYCTGKRQPSLKVLSRIESLTKNLVRCKDFLK